VLHGEKRQKETGKGKNRKIKNERKTVGLYIQKKEMKEREIK
jgi:hypothetical protein